MQIAVYGKGGIGKSTVSANLSAALACCGKKVLQIGCDPKHDSTRLLHHGQKVETILEYLLNTPADEQRPEAVLMNGYNGVGCVEAGGPRPGMGCAGRGILTSFDFLNKFQVFSNYEHIVYDVLGDVVCGGFAVPVRRQYAEAVFLVTSGEAMAIYAANNILQGIRNLNQKERRIAGIIYNSRGIGDESTRVYAFAEAVGLPVCVRIPRSDRFARAEREAVTVVEQDLHSEEAQIFLNLAHQIEAGLELHEAKPLTEEQMEHFMRGEAPMTIGRTEERSTVSRTCEKTEEFPKEKVLSKKRALSDPFSRVPLFGCAFNGAVALAIHVKDAAVLAHAPKSCVWFSQNGFTAYARRGFYERGILYPAFIPQHFEATDLTMQDAVFGGVEHAREKALALAAKGVRTILAVTSCIPGMSGDDLTPLKEELKALGCEMYLIPTDGVAAGDYNEGMALCYKTLAREAIDRNVEPEKDSINLVYELTWSSATDQNYQIIKAMLDGLGIRVNCRFLCATSMEEIHGFLRAPYSVMARDDVLGEELKAIFEQKYGCRFLDGTFPKGFSETTRWVRQLGSLYEKESQAEALIAREKARYQERIQALKPNFQGKKCIIFLNRPGNEWLFEVVEDLGLEQLAVFVAGKEKENNAGWNHRFSAKWETDQKKLVQAIKELPVELILTSDRSALADVPNHVTVIDLMANERPGFLTGVEAAEAWKDLMGTKMEGRWKRDRILFEKYYT